MPGLSVEDLGPPPSQYRVDQRTDDPSGLVKFETRVFSLSQNELRARLLKATIASGALSRKERRAARLLASWLEHDEAKQSARFSAGSSLMMREWRIRICGWLWSLIAQLAPSEWRFFTIALPKWWVRSSRLSKVKAGRIMASLRQALRRAGAADATGWLYAMIHGEYDASTRGFSLHVHGLATEGMIKVLRGLRKQPQFRRGKHDRRRYPQVSISRKLKIDKPREYLPAVITYTSKSYWPEHNSVVGEDGKRRRVGHKHRISGKHHTRYLLWLNAHRLKDLTLLVHLRVTRNGLTSRREGSCSN